MRFSYCILIVNTLCASIPLHECVGADFGNPLPLYYDVSTGNATIDITNVFGGETAGYAIGNDLCGNPCSLFRPENHTPFMSSHFVTSTTALIGESNFDGVPNGVYSLGSVFPVGLSEQELREAYFVHDALGATHFDVIGPAGSSVRHAFQPIYSPSPFPAINDTSVGPSTVVAQWATDAQLRYNELTGELVLDSDGRNGGAVFTYDIELNEPLFDVGAFNAISVAGIEVATVGLTKLLEADWNGIPAGVHSLGEVLPTGLSESELLNVIKSASFLGQPGHDVESLDINASGIAMSIQHIVPEPQLGARTLVLMLIVVSRLRRSISR